MAPGPVWLREAYSVLNTRTLGARYGAAFRCVRAVAWVGVPYHAVVHYAVCGSGDDGAAESHNLVLVPHVPRQIHYRRCIT